MYIFLYENQIKTSCPQVAQLDLQLIDSLIHCWGWFCNCHEPRLIFSPILNLFIPGSTQDIIDNKKRKKRSYCLNIWSRTVMEYSYNWNFRLRQGRVYAGVLFFISIWRIDLPNLVQQKNNHICPNSQKVRRKKRG